MDLSTLITQEHGQPLRGRAVVSGFKTVPYGGGKTRLVGTLTDASGQLLFVHWKPWQVRQDIQDGDVVEFLGKLGTYRDKLQLNIDHMSLAWDTSIDISTLVPSAPLPGRGEGTWDELLMSYAHSLQTDPAKRLWSAFFERYGERFLAMPAAKKMHHAFREGLAMHTASMLTAAVELGHWYSSTGFEIDHDVLALGVLMHDAGKMVELGDQGGADWTDLGHLLGHISIGSTFWNRLCDDDGDVPARLRVGVDHVILSHHGDKYKGSPVGPKTPEAFIVSAVDRLDAQLWTLRGATPDESGKIQEWALGGDAFPALPEDPGDPETIARQPTKGPVIRGQKPQGDETP